MAVVALSHNITRTEDFEGTPPGTIISFGGGPAATVGSDLFYEGAQSLRRRIGATGANRGFTYVDIVSHDVQSAAKKIWYIKHLLAVEKAINPAGAINGYATGGIANGVSVLTADDGSAGDNKDFQYPIKGGWIINPVEMELTAYKTLGVVGSFNLAAVDAWVHLNNVSATSTGENQAMDCIDLTTDGLFLIGGTSTDPDATFQDFIDADEGEGLTGAERVGMWSTIEPKVFSVFGHHIIGKTGAGTVTATVFTDAGVTLIFPGGNVREARNQIEFDIGNAGSAAVLSLCSILGRGRSEVQACFDTELQVNATTDRITSPAHGLGTGDQVEYIDNGGAQDIGPDDATGEPLVFASATTIGSGPHWYVGKFDADEFTLYPTVQDALESTAAAALTASTAGNGERHTLKRTPDARPDLTVTGTAGTAAFNDCVFDGLRKLTFTSEVTMSRGFIINSLQLVLGDATLNSVVVIEPTTFIGEAFLQAIHAQDLDLIDGTSFSTTGQGHAIEITTGGTLAQRTGALQDVSYSGYFATDEDNTGGWSFNANTDVDAVGDDITITGHAFVTGDAVYYSDEGGTAIGGLTDQALYYLRKDDANTVGVFATKEAADTNVNRIALTVGSSETHKFYSANATIFNNTGADVILNLNGGTTPTVRNSAGSTTTINNTVTLQVAAVDEDNVAIPYASVSIQNASTGAEISSGVANNLGIYTDSTFNYTVDIAVNVVVRKSSPGATRYKAASSPNTIVNNGLDAVVSLAVNRFAGLIPMVGVLRHGVQSEDVNDAIVTATVDMPEGTNRVLVCAGIYWGSGSDLTVSAATYDGNAMTSINSLAVAAFHEIFLYRHAIPDGDDGEKVISFTFSANVDIKAIAFAIVDDATAAPESNDTDNGNAVTGNPSLALNNTTANSFSVGFLITDDLDSPTATGASENRVRRSDLARDALLNSIAVLIADRSTAGAHNIGADYGANTKTWVAAGATFAKN